LSLTQILGKRGRFEIASGFIEYYSKNYFIIISALLVNNGSSCACSCLSSVSAKALLWDIHNKVNNYLLFIWCALNLKSPFGCCFFLTNIFMSFKSMLKKAVLKVYI